MALTFEGHRTGQAGRYRRPRARTVVLGVGVLDRRRHGHGGWVHRPSRTPEQVMSLAAAVALGAAVGLVLGTMVFAGLLSAYFSA